MRFRLWLEARGQFEQQLMSLRPQLASAAQAVYDAWEQDEEGMDDEYGGGGICHDIAEAMADVINNSIPNVEAGSIGYDGVGEVHVYVVAIFGNEAYTVDIPPNVYETGGGYSWQKIADVTFSPTDVQIYPIDVEDARNALEYQ